MNNARKKNTISNSLLFSLIQHANSSQKPTLELNPQPFFLEAAPTLVLNQLLHSINRASEEGVESDQSYHSRRLSETSTVVSTIALYFFQLYDIYVTYFCFAAGVPAPTAGAKAGISHLPELLKPRGLFENLSGSCSHPAAFLMCAQGRMCTVQTKVKYTQNTLFLLRMNVLRRLVAVLIDYVNKHRYYIL